MIQNFAFFFSHPVPNVSSNDWVNNAFASAVPRGLEACVFCAVRDYLEHRYEVFLYKEATGMTTMTKFNYHKTRDPMTEGGKEVDAQTATHGLLVHGRTFCLGPAEKIDALLGVQHYSKLWPHIPKQELYASSVRHPRHPTMHWLLHSRRVPKDVPNRKHSEVFSSGVAKEDQICYACRDCVEHLCTEHPQMPPMAIANGFWLGREHPQFQTLSLGTKLLLGKGRPVMRQIFLGQGCSSESYKGLIGNTILVAQAHAAKTEILPSINKLLDTLVIFFVNQWTKFDSAGL